MFLEKLQLNGFKSFAQKVELKFNPGITAIVGPNGSGKSNVADAIRWVLGEQSMKLIRGKKSEDVIFAGSSKKSRLGMAEVVLQFNNEDGTAPLDYSQIVLTRRFYRSGEGEYLLNNSRSRLFDIQMMLAQANIGSKTYSVIGQGQIDAVLVATPAERKDFFDEATGVKQYQIKRDQALNKLERTYANMSQGKLMLNEIKPRLKSLTRQVRRLEQKELVEKELINLQHNYYYNLWKSYAGSQDELNKNKEILQEKLAGLNEEVSQLQSEMKKTMGDKSREDEFSSLQSQYEDKQKIKQDLLRELVMIEGRQDISLAKDGAHDLVWARRRQEEIDARTTSRTETIDKLKNIIAELKSKQASDQSEQEKVKVELSDLDSKIKELSQTNNGKVTLPEVRRHLLGVIEKLKQLQSKANQSDDIEVMKSSCRELSAIFQSLSDLANNLPTGKEGQDKQVLTELQSNFENLKTKQENFVNQLSDIRVEIKVAETRLETAQEDLDLLQEEKDKLQRLDIKSQDAGQLGKDVKRKLAEVDKDLDNINEQLKSFNQVQQAKKEEILAQQSKLQSSQHKINDLNREQSSIEVELAKVETKQEDLALEVHRELQTFMAGLIDDWKKNPPQLEEKVDEDEILERINSLKKKKEMIGGIEPEAASEYKEVKERHDFLNNQVKDLTESMEKLKNSIDDLDKIINKQFTDNFHQINELFNKYFRMLFNGGRAELVLMKNEVNEKDKTGEEELTAEENSDEDQIEEEEEEEEEDLIKMYKSKRLIQGIEIKAVPPGKKMKSIGMLSGGERALTSIALICAMIANNPSPFVVLDEVDAALDEANSLRFAEIVSDLAKQTQFVIISHNRATMEKADILYGVTMGSDGVSNFLSVKFEEAQEYANRY